MDVVGRDSEPLHRTASRHGQHNRFAKSCNCIGDFTGGQVWIKDDEETSPDEVVMKNKIHRLRGLWLDMYNKPVSFNARRYHKSSLTRGGQ